MPDLAQQIVEDMQEHIKKIRKKLLMSKQKKDYKMIRYYQGQVTILSKLIRTWQPAAY